MWVRAGVTGIKILERDLFDRVDGSALLFVFIMT